VKGRQRDVWRLHLDEQILRPQIHIRWLVASRLLFDSRKHTQPRLLESLWRVDPFDNSAKQDETCLRRMLPRVVLR
jgi:hypothetical protein